MRRQLISLLPLERTQTALSILKQAGMSPDAHGTGAVCMMNLIVNSPSAAKYDGHGRTVFRQSGLCRLQQLMECNDGPTGRLSQAYSGMYTYLGPPEFGSSGPRFVSLVGATCVTNASNA